MNGSHVRYNPMFPMRAVKHWNRWCEGATIGDVARLVEDAGPAQFLLERCRLRG
jgi:hypothetical protein